MDNPIKKTSHICSQMKVLFKTMLHYFTDYFNNLKPLSAYSIKNLGGGERDSSVGKLSASQSGDVGLNTGGGLTRVTQCMNKRGRDFQL